MSPWPSEIRRTSDNAGRPTKPNIAGRRPNSVDSNVTMTNETATTPEYRYIPVRPETRDELRKRKAYLGISYEELIRREMFDD